MPLDISPPTTAPIVLIVEDPLTRDYLREVWVRPVDVAFVLGGGNDGVRAIVRSFEDEGVSNVFGLTDRDFRPSNVGDWENPQKTFRTFVLPAHEIENYLLSAEALHAIPWHNRGLDVSQIQEHMLQKARSVCWWAACRDVIADLKRRFREPFIPDPRQTVTDEKSAQDHICESDWFQKLPNEATILTPRSIADALLKAHAAAGQRLVNGEWRRDFAGKEIYRDVAGWICDQPRLSRQPTNQAAFYSDAAKDIAAWQAANNQVPAELTTLLEVLRGRIVRRL